MQIRRFDKRWLGRRTPSPRRTTSEGRSSKSPSIISALIMLLLPLAGVISGGLITYFSSQQLEEGKNLIKLRTQAYVDYTQSVIRLASLNRGESRDNTKPASENSKSESDAVIAAQDARVRIGLYGSKKVTERFAEYLDVIENNKGDGPAAQERFFAVYNAMREETNDDESSVSRERLRRVLFPCSQSDGASIGGKDVEEASETDPFQPAEPDPELDLAAMLAPDLPELKSSKSKDPSQRLQAAFQAFYESAC